jgi:hypothetical protein
MSRLNRKAVRRGRSTRLVMTRGAVASAAILAIAMMVPGAAQVGATTQLAPPGFGVPTISGIQGYGYEPGLAVDPLNGDIYTTVPDTASTGTSVIWRSSDGGQTFKWIPASAPLTGKPLTCIGGGDSELAVDTGHHLYFNDLTAANFSVARSDDAGTSFAAVPNCAGVPEAGVDRPWYTTQGDATKGGAVFLAYDRVAQSLPAGICPAGTPATNNVLVLARSPAFGQPGATAGLTFSPSQVLSCDEGIMGNDVFFKYRDTGPRVFVIHDNAALGKISVDRCDVAAESLNLPGLRNCVESVVSDFTGVGVTGGNFPTLSVDDRGGLFAVWEEAPGTLTLGTPSNTPNITGNTQLFYSFSTNEGATWSTPTHIPTPGLNQDLFAWPGSGDPGHVDVAFYGAPEAWQPGDVDGPDSINGHYGLYVVQTLNGGGTWSRPVLASEHFIHYGTMQTLIGGQQTTSSRVLGDFLKLKVGAQGQAEISYGDSNNDSSQLTPASMFVQQVSGHSVYKHANGTGHVNGVAPSTTGCVGDPTGDATFDANGVISADQPNLDLEQVCMTQPDAGDYQVTLKVADLTTLASTDQAEGTTLIWQVQWFAPSQTDLANGGAMFMVYLESVNGGAPTCWVGQNATTGSGQLTYPGATQLSGSACTYTATAPGTITITVPLSDVTEAGAGPTQYSVTGSTQALTGNAENPPNTGFLGIGGNPFNLVDVAPAFDLTPA